MTTVEVSVSSEWLTLREPADAAARAPDLVEVARSSLPARGVVVHDLGCGTGSMARWVAGRLDLPQHWVLFDRDPALLSVAVADLPRGPSRRAPVSAETRQRDITRLEVTELAGADLITASALLDMLTAEDLDRLLATCTRADCPVLVALSVTGAVDLAPADPLDQHVADAFNAHQRRRTGRGRLLGPDAVGAALNGFTKRGFEVQVRASPWRLGPGEATLATQWFTGWLAAACEQQPELAADGAAYARRRLEQAAAGRLCVTVHHQDVLARPMEPRRRRWV